MVHEASLVKDFDHELLFYNHHFKIRNFIIFISITIHRTLRLKFLLTFTFCLLLKISDFSIDREKEKFEFK